MQTSQYESFDQQSTSSENPNEQQNEEQINISEVSIPNDNTPLTSHLLSTENNTNNENNKQIPTNEIIKRNLQEILYEQIEYEEINGKKQRTTKSKQQLITNSFSMSFSMINCIIGAGILSLAQSCHKMGIIGYSIWLLLTGVYFYVIWKYYNKAIYYTNSTTMGELLSLLFGKVIACIVDISQSLFFFCYMFCYQVIATQYIFGIIQDLTTREQWNNTIDECYGKPQRTIGVHCEWHYIILFILSICVLLPLIIPKSVTFVNRISFLVLISAGITTFVVFGKTIYYGMKGISSNESDKNIPSTKGKWLPIGIMEFFTMAPFITSNFIINSLLPALYSQTTGLSKKTKLKSLNYGAIFTNVFTVILYLIIAISGNIAFDDVSSNILNDFVNSERKSIDWLSIICRLLMTLTVIVSYPGLMFPLCVSVQRYIPKTWKIMQIRNGDIGIMILRIIIWILSTILACFITDIGVVFSIIASVFALPILYYGPMTIMMIWPRFEILGEPSYRKLSVVENVLYKNYVKGKQYFEEKEIKRIMNEIEKRMNNNEINIENTEINNNNEINSIENKMNNKKYEEVIDEIMKEIEMKEDIEIADEKEGYEMDEIQIENETNDEKEEDKEEEDDLIENGINLKLVGQNKIVKLPYVNIPKWRYIVYGTAMGIVTVLCIISIIGTIIDSVNK